MEHRFPPSLGYIIGGHPHSFNFMQFLGNFGAPWTVDTPPLGNPGSATVYAEHKGINLPQVRLRNVLKKNLLQSDNDHVNSYSLSC